MMFVITAAQTIRHPFFTGCADVFAPLQIEPDQLKLDSIQGFSMADETDSIYSDLYYYSYDERGNRTIAMCCDPDSDISEPGECEYSSRFIYTWNERDLLVESRMKVPDEDYEMKTQYSYSDSDTLISELYFWSHDGTAWDTIAQRDIYYYSDSIVHIEMGQGTHSNWKQLYSYDELGRQSSYVKFFADENEDPVWIIQEKEDYTYDPEGNWIQRLSYFDSGSGLKKTLLTAWAYTDGILTLLQNQYYNDEGIEVLATQETYEYNEMGLLADQYDNKLHGDTWVTQKHQHYDYNEDSLLITYLSYLYDTDWEPVEKKEYSYDESGNKSYEVTYWYDQDWIKNNMELFYYSSLNVENNLQELVAEALIFPNPTSGNIYLRAEQGDIQNMMLYTLQGESIPVSAFKQAQGTIRLSIDFPGTYILVVQYNSGMISSARIIVF